MSVPHVLPARGFPRTRALYLPGDADCFSVLVALRVALLRRHNEARMLRRCCIVLSLRVACPSSLC